MADEIVLEAICKSFEVLRALEQVTLRVRPGTVHALVGENGAGKTTLMRILYGLEQPDAGRIMLAGKAVVMRDPSCAQGHGIGMIQQDFPLVGSFTVLEAVLLGHKTVPWVIDYRKRARQLRELSQSFGFDIKPNAVVRDLSSGSRQRVEILRLLYWQADVLILDEPTSLLAPQEVEGLFTVLRRLKNAGKTILFITHKLSEVMTLADRVTVLKKGRIVAETGVADTNPEVLAHVMTGEKPQSDSCVRHILDADPALELRNLTVRGPSGGLAVKGVSLKLRPGELFGLAGVSGNGQTELAEAIVGLRRARLGGVMIDGKDVTRLSVATRRREFGVSYAPSDRGVGLLFDEGVASNTVLCNWYSSKFTRWGILLWERIREYASLLVNKYGISARSSDQLVRHLSGGNQQRLVIGRELEDNPRVLVADNPCQGLDLRATDFIHRALLERTKNGMAALYISSELDDLRAVCDRIGVMYRGELRGVLLREEASKERLGRLMAGFDDAGVAA